MNPYGRIAMACTLLTVVPAPAASAAAPSVAGQFADFDGDGYGDLAVGATHESIGRLSYAGAVTVLYGTASGLTAARAQQWSQATPGIADDPETGDMFGSALAAGDFDGDGFSDLAIGAARESVPGTGAVGMVHVLYGSPSGLTTVRAEAWSADALRGAPAPMYQHFGWALAAGDVDADGHDDLAVGGHRDVVAILKGTAGGLVPAQRIADPKRTALSFYGATLEMGDFDGDGDDDLAIGAFNESVIEGSGTARTVEGAGQLWVLSGGALGLADPVSFDQDSPGVNGLPEKGDEFAFALAAGDFDGDGDEDLAVGSPSDSTVGSADAGVVHVFPGTPSGLTGAGSRLWHQAISGVPGSPDVVRPQVDLFGKALAARDVDGDGLADLAVGAPYDEVGDVRDAGTVTLFRGSPTGLTTARIALWHQDVAGVGGTAEYGDRFGAAVATADVNGDGRADLAIGAPEEDVGRAQASGVLHVLRSGPAGLAAAQSQLWDQDTPGVPGGQETLDNFGRTLAG
ncbi:MAG TPA: FG-GAP repeat protein [Frankiaceae bacterium]|nr:FG-GAP repeat protein [Frankiaceae bacterium]